jgi:hypothetical protein
MIEVHLNQVPAGCDDRNHQNDLQSDVMFEEIDLKRLQHFQAQHSDQNSGDRSLRYEEQVLNAADMAQV